MKLLVVMIAIFCQVSNAQANEVIKKGELVSSTFVEDVEITSGSLVVCADGDSTSEASISLATLLSYPSIEVRARVTSNTQKTVRMQKPYSSVSAPAVSIDNGRAFAKVQICVTVSKDKK